MWPFKKKQQQVESPDEKATPARLDEATDEAAAEALDQAFALPALGGEGLAGGLATAGFLERERLREKADEADEETKP